MMVHRLSGHPGALLALFLGGLALVPTGCTQLKRDVEYSLIPARPHVVEQPAVRVELLDISRAGGDDYLVVRIRVDNLSTGKATFEPSRVALVIGDQVKQAIDEYRPARTKPSRAKDADPGDDADDAEWDEAEQEMKNWLAEKPRRPPGSGVGDNLDELKDSAKDAAEGVAKGAVAGVYLAGKVTEYAIKGTYYAVKGTALAIRGAHKLIDNSIHNARRHLDPGESSILAIRFDDIPTAADVLPSYLFFEDSMVTAKGEVFPIQPLIVANPQEPHMGFQPPQRARLAAGLRFGMGTTFAAADAVNVPDLDRFLGVQAYLGPRIGPWSFTGVGAAGTGFMLGFDIRRDIVETPRFLSTLYLGYGRHWLLNADEGTTDGRGARIGMEFMGAFSRRAYDWHVTTSAVGGFLEVTPMTLGDGTGVHVSAGLSWLAF